MKRFLMLVAVAVVASAMYVAASSASQQSSAPSAKQFSALKKKVAKMSRILTTVKRQAAEADDYVKHCLTASDAGIMPVTEYGDGVNHQWGYMYKDGATTTYTTALDIDTGSTPGAFLQEVATGCANK